MYPIDRLCQHFDADFDTTEIMVTKAERVVIPIATGGQCVLEPKQLSYIDTRGNELDVWADYASGAKLLVIREF